MNEHMKKKSRKKKVYDILLDKSLDFCKGEQESDLKEGRVR